MNNRGKSEFLTNISELLDQLFPEREIHLRTADRISFWKISQAAQVLALLLVTSVVGWSGFTSISYVLHEKVVVEKENHIAKARYAYQSLLSEVETYQKKFTSITRDLEENNDLMLGLVEKNASLQQNINSVSQVLAVTETKREKIFRNRENLKQDLASIEGRMNGIIKRNLLLRDNLNSVEGNLQSALAERNRARLDGTQKSLQVKELETRLLALQNNQENSIQKLTERTNSYIENVENVIETAGLEVNKVLKLQENNPASAQGGPFIPAKLDGLPGERLKASLSNLDYHLNRWEGLQSVVSALPMSAPMVSYQITSKYGKRHDPINKRWSAHYGIDLSAPLRSRIYTPSAGVVTHAGWKGKYGKLIIIDHGAGIKTKYGHLNKIYVKKGQKVKSREKIGLLGNTGRSTGAHLHYEVSFLGKTMDPMKFLKAGQYVFKEQ